MTLPHAVASRLGAQGHAPTDFDDGIHKLQVESAMAGRVADALSDRELEEANGTSLDGVPWSGSFTPRLRTVRFLDSYVRRAAEHGVLHRVVLEHLRSFLGELDRQDEEQRCLVVREGKVSAIRSPRRPRE